MYRRAQGAMGGGWSQASQLQSSVSLGKESEWRGGGKGREDHLNMVGGLGPQSGTGTGHVELLRDTPLPGHTIPPGQGVGPVTGPHPFPHVSAGKNPLPSPGRVLGREVISDGPGNRGSCVT